MRGVPPTSVFSTVQVQLPAWSRVTLKIVRLRVVDPEMPVPSETVRPLSSNHEMVGVGLPLTRLAHTRVMLPPSRTEVSTSGPMNSGGSVMKKRKLLGHSNDLRSAAVYMYSTVFTPKKGNITHDFSEHSR